MGVAPDRGLKERLTFIRGGIEHPLSSLRFHCKHGLVFLSRSSQPPPYSTSTSEGRVGSWQVGQWKVVFSLVELLDKPMKLPVDSSHSSTLLVLEPLSSIP